MMHTTGTPAWIDLMTTDRRSAMAFYNAVFGWTYEEQIVDNAVAYVVARHDQRDTAGIATRTPEEIAQGVPPAWNLFFATDDIQTTCTRVQELGGQVLNPPFEAMAAGRMAVIADPTGAISCLWQAKQHAGLATMHVPGTLTWCECLTRDPAAAATFYERLFGWKTEVTFDGTAGYTLCHVDGTPTAGIMAMPPGLEEVPANWMIYFAVKNCDQSITAAERQGGTLLNGPMEYGTGKFAVVGDPQGAVFGIIEPLE